jgi:hypothetical protein
LFLIIIALSTISSTFQRTRTISQNLATKSTNPVETPSLTDITITSEDKLSTHRTIETASTTTNKIKLDFSNTTPAIITTKTTTLDTMTPTIYTMLTNSESKKSTITTSVAPLSAQTSSIISSLSSIIINQDTTEITRTKVDENISLTTTTIKLEISIIGTITGAFSSMPFNTISYSEKTTTLISQQYDSSLIGKSKDHLTIGLSGGIIASGLLIIIIITIVFVIKRKNIRVKNSNNSSQNKSFKIDNQQKIKK